MATGIDARLWTQSVTLRYSARIGSILGGIMTEGPERSSDVDASTVSADTINRMQVASGEATIAAAKATRVSAIIAGISAVTSAVALGISLYAAHVAKQQNSNAQQQALVTLVSDIAQEPLSIAQAAESIKNNPETLHNVDVQIELTELGEGEEANNIIQGLPNSDVSSVEEYQVGLALENGEDYMPALKLLTNAAQKASDPRTEADSWRVAARILYALGRNSKAEGDIKLAKNSFNGPDVTLTSKDNNIADTELFDISFQVSIDCSTTMSEWDKATQIIAKNRAVLTGSLSMVEKTAAADLHARCHVPWSTLKKALYVGQPAG